MEHTLTQKIEAILFYTGEPVTYAFLSETLEVSEEEIKMGVEKLIQELMGRGITVVGKDNTIMLATAPSLSGIIEKLVKEERERDLGRAGIETLAIIAYKGPVSKKEIEYIRGVNSQFALRSLLLRGLIEKQGSKVDERVILYTITHDALLHLGLARVDDLPDFDMVKQKLEVEEMAEEDSQELK